jgi:hypothetical protein
VFNLGQSRVPGRLSPLTALEVAALMQIRARTALDPTHREAGARLCELGLVEKTSAGLVVTPLGAALSRFESDVAKVVPDSRGDAPSKWADYRNSLN